MSMQELLALLLLNFLWTPHRIETLKRLPSIAVHLSHILFKIGLTGIFFCCAIYVVKGVNQLGVRVLQARIILSLRLKREARGDTTLVGQNVFP